MTQITSLHLTHSDLRVLLLSTDPNNLSIDFCKTLPIDEYAQLPDITQLDLETHVPNLTKTVVVTLGGGLFHIQKVPLEVASEPDRRAQIMWEAEQVLIDKTDQFVIDFLPTGRVAFWTAIRTEITEKYTQTLTQLGYESVYFVPEPLALFALSKATHNEQNQGAIWVGADWGSFVTQTDKSLTTAQTVSFQNKGHNKGHILTQIKHWVQGDLNNERRRPSCDHILLCGEQDELSPLQSYLSEIRTPRIVTFDATSLPIETHDAQLDAETFPSFALSLGAALAHTQ